MQVYFNEYGSSPKDKGRFTPQKYYEASLVMHTGSGTTYMVMDDRGQNTTVFVGNTESAWTDSVWFKTDECHNELSDHEDEEYNLYNYINPKVFSIGMVLCENNTGAAVMEDEGELSDFTPVEYDGLYVEVGEYVDLLRKFEKLLSENKDLHGENAAMSTTIDNVNKVIGPNQPGEETLSEKVKRHTVKTEKIEESSSSSPFTEKNHYATNGLNISICYRGI